MSASWETSARSSMPWMRNTCRSVDVERVDQPPQHARRHVVGHLEPHDVAEPAPAQLDLHRLEQVVGVVRHVEVGVAGDPERRRLDDLHAREEPRQEVGDHLLEREHHLVAADGHEPGHALGHLHPRQALLAVGRIAHEHAQAERQARDVRERLAGADRKRRQHRVDLALVVGGERAQLGPGGLLDPPDLDARPATARAASSRSYSVDCRDTWSRTRSAISSSVACGAAAVGRAHVEPRRRLALEAGDAHHEELVQAGGDERAQADAVQQRDARRPGRAGCSARSSRATTARGSGTAPAEPASGGARRATARRRRAVWSSVTPAPASPLSAGSAIGYPNRPVTYASVRSSDGRVNSSTVGACSTRTPQREPGLGDIDAEERGHVGDPRCLLHVVGHDHNRIVVLQFGNQDPRSSGWRSGRAPRPARPSARRRARWPARGRCRAAAAGRPRARARST